MSQTLTDGVATSPASPSAWLAQRIFGMPLPFFALALAVMVAAIATALAVDSSTPASCSAVRLTQTA